MAGGRPPKFETDDELQECIESFFKSLEYIESETGRKMMAPATITGLALALGFCSRQSMYDYEKNDKFSYTIKNARLRVENSYEQHLFTKSAGGAIFGLKNMGWADKQEIDQKVEMTGAPIINFADTTKKED
jgi:hypothetical protein